MEQNVKLSVQGVSCALGGKTVLNNVSLDIYDGEFLSVLGPSGCGKTTLLRLILGLEKPTAGKIFRDGEDITERDTAKRHMGVVFQNYALFESMSVLRNVEYALLAKKEYRGRAGRARAKDEALAMLKLLGLEAHKDKKPASLSGGQQQRTAIARTLVLHPDVILFDEPMSALDAATRVTLREELLHLQRSFGITVIYVTHDQEEAFAMSDRIVVMREASVVQIGTPEELLREPKDEYVREFVLESLRARANTLVSLAERGL